MTQHSVISDTLPHGSLTATQVWSILSSSNIFDPYAPAKFWSFRRLVFDHRVFVGTGADLLEQTGHADSREGYRSFLGRYCPEGLANEILAANGETLTYRTNQKRLRILHSEQPDYGQAQQPDPSAFFLDDVVTPEDIDDRIDRQWLLEILPEVLQSLTSFERRAISLRFGLNDRRGEEHTFEQIAEALDRSTDRARQAVLCSLRKLADAIHRHRSPLAPGPDLPLPLELSVDRRVPTGLTGERRFYYLVQRYGSERYFDLVHGKNANSKRPGPAWAKETFLRVIKRLTK